MGRLRAVQSCARPHERGPGRRGAVVARYGPSTPATCGPRCTRTPSRAKTSPTARCPRRSSPTSWRSSRRDARAGATGCRTCDRHAARARDGGVMTTVAPTAGPPSASDRALPVFELPPELEASSPARGPGHDQGRGAHARGHARDGSLVHSHFSELPRFLDEGDLIVVNTSGTLAAAVPGVDRAGSAARGALLHPAARRSVDRRAAPRGRAVVRRPSRRGRSRSTAVAAVDLLAPYAAHPPGRAPVDRRRATPGPLHTYLAVHGHPIRYGYVRGSWPISTYQNVYATEPGSAEMPSAGPALHSRGPHPAGGAGRRSRPDRAAHRRGLARGLRTALPRVLPGDAGHRPPGQRHPRAKVGG